MPGLEVLFAPWRYSYVVRASQEKHECIFCRALREDEDEALVLVRSRRAFVMMNLYPYNTGHVMVAPVRHVASLEELEDDELLELMKLVKLSLKAIRDVLSPHGFNVGVNIGRVAGAGIEDHVHVHVVPRWSGDTNFMPVVAGVKVIPQDVRETYRRLKPRFQSLARSYL